MINCITWEQIYSIWCDYARKVDVRVEKMPEVFKIKVSQAKYDTFSYGVNWLSIDKYQEQCKCSKKNLDMHIDEIKEQDMYHTIQLLRQAGSNQEKLALVWIGVFIHGMRQLEQNKNEDMCTAIEQIIKEQMKKKKLKYWEDGQQRKVPTYIFSASFLESIGFSKIEYLLEMIILNTSYILNRFKIVEYESVSKKRCDKKVFHQAIAKYWYEYKSSKDATISLAEVSTRCWCCGRKNKLIPFHIIPKSVGGTDSVGNFILLCYSCTKKAPRYSNPNAVFEWLKAHKVNFYDNYCSEESEYEYKLIYKRELKKDFIELYELFQSRVEFDLLYKKILSQKKKQVGNNKKVLNAATWAVLQYETLEAIRKKLSLTTFKFDEQINYNDFNGQYYIELPHQIYKEYQGRYIEAMIEVDGNRYQGDAADTNGVYYFHFESKEKIDIKNTKKITLEKIII